MRITDLLKKESISLNRELASKSDAIDALIDLHEKAGNLSDKDAYKKAILAREAQGSTAVDDRLHQLGKCSRLYHGSRFQNLSRRHSCTCDENSCGFER